MKKKFLALFMVLCLSLSLVPAAFAAEDVGEAWDGTTITEAPYVNDRYEISTGAQLAWLAREVNGGENFYGDTIAIVDDIDLGGQNFIPIGTRGEPFQGTLTGIAMADGEYPTISNANINHGSSIINVGVIGFVNNGGIVQNLTFSNIDVVSTANKSSAFLDEYESTTGVAVGTVDNGAISNVTVDATCSVSGVLRTGGIAGDISHEGTIVDCTNYATVIGSNDYTGGITGAAHNAPTTASAYGATISGCANYGAVTGTSSVGGIVGYADRAHVSNCTNSAAITGSGNYGTGGIVGANVYNIYRVFLVNRKPTVATIIDNCTNSGSVSAPRAGGILGAYFSAPGDAQPDNLLNCTITNCTNTNTITGTKAGAIFGYQISYAAGDADTNINHMGVVIQHCGNTGSPEALSASTIAVTIEE